VQDNLGETDRKWDLEKLAQRQMDLNIRYCQSTALWSLGHRGHGRHCDFLRTMHLAKEEFHNAAEGGRVVVSRGWINVA